MKTLMKIAVLPLVSILSPGICKDTKVAMRCQGRDVEVYPIHQVSDDEKGPVTQ